MAKKYFLVHFTGHDQPKLQGGRDASAFKSFASLLQLGQDVSRFAFYAGLGEKQSEKVAINVKGIVDGYAGGNTDGITFIVHGNSAGGVTALYFAKRIPDAQIVNIALADAAFYRGETDHLMHSPGSLAYYLSENYYQTYENNPGSDEIHDKITADGWTNLQITQLSPAPWYSLQGDDYHRRAVSIADKMILGKMRNVIETGK